MSKKSVLIVDDGSSNRLFIKSFMITKGFDAETAADGMEGLALAKERHFDLIFSDIEMPNMNGIEFLEAVKKVPTYASTPVVILSTVTKPEIIQRTKELGAVYYMVKPFNNEKMDEALKIAGFAG